MATTLFPFGSAGNQSPAQDAASVAARLDALHARASGAFFETLVAIAATDIVVAVVLWRGLPRSIIAVAAVIGLAWVVVAGKRRHEAERAQSEIAPELYARGYTLEEIAWLTADPCDPERSAEPPGRLGEIARA